MKKFNRRKLIKRSAVASAAIASGCSLDPKGKQQDGSESAQKEGSEDQAGEIKSGIFDPNEKFLIVLGCFGGAAINDSFMAMSEDEVRKGGGDPSRLNCFKESQITRLSDSPFTAMKVDKTIETLGGFEVKADQSAFLKKHYKDMMVATTQGTSVNHAIAQARCLQGNDAWGGKTVQEAVAEQYGKNKPVANLNMGSGGYAFAGIDPSLDEHALQFTVSDPKYWPLSLHSTAGLSNGADKNILEMARKFRDHKIEPNSNFYKTFKNSNNVKKWLADRTDKIVSFEQLDLVNKLFFMGNASEGLSGSAEAEKLRKIFPNYHQDNFEAQAIMAYLAITQGVSTSVTLSPDSAISTSGNISDFINPPIAFDFSHTDHRGTQAMMWARMLGVADRLIDLLKSVEFNPLTGESFFDRTMIYFATDFGRSKNREPDAETFDSGHDLNNASLLISPFVNGNKVLGGVDPSDLNTYGFDLDSGAPEKGRKTSEKEFYAGLLEAMDVDTEGSGLPSVKSFKKS